MPWPDVVRSGVEDELNLTAYLDILMTLTAFVLLSGAGFVALGEVAATRELAPQVDHPDRVHIGPPRVRLERDRVTVAIGGPAVVVSLDELPERLRAASGRQLIVEAAPDVTLEQVIAAMDAARKAHFDEVTLAD